MRSDKLAAQAKRQDLAVDGMSDPTIILRHSRLKLLVLVLLSGLLATACSMSLTAENQTTRLAGFVGLLLFGAGTALAALLLIRPGRLILSPQGLVFRGAFRSYHYDWADFVVFLIWSPPGVLWLLRQPAFILSEQGQVKRSWLSRRLNGRLGAFGTCWDRRPAEIVDQLNAARWRWGGLARDG